MDTILKALDILIEERLWEGKKPSEVLNILMYVHNKGFLYTPIIDGKVMAVLCAYRISEISDNTLKNLPIDESGDILYVPFVISMYKDVNLFDVIRQSMRSYLDKNPDIKKIVLEDKNNQIKCYNLNGERYGKESEARASSTANV